ncbi:SipW-dependent-type signal peptide-containing protein [Gordonia sp. OPL2]|uniref:SipW-dependent-type signal peptide-containing protein n=1 Tax=Gordonia sp. OPL2 TaxID=2486274 RepID=UPI001655DF08|nr:SipW-dependent-type signal peptide-containing protein [Gordonia sp. OPL2]
MSGVVSMRIRALLSLGVILGLGTVSTLATWSASTTTTSGVFTTGTVDIALNDADATVTSPYTVTLGRALLPGDSAGVPLIVQNRGSLAVRYTTAVRSADATGRAMRLRITTGATVSGGSCSGGTATTVVDQAITAGDTAILGTRGPLAGGTGADPLCVQFTLPTDAPNSVQTTSGGVQFTFVASAVTSVV